ncbi:hypothetical protein AAVH_16385 [Aphelenchoides avenae]|nr:hypothetical protein AAVH_16385 [Aphelenchus avenae]
MSESESAAEDEQEEFTVEKVLRHATVGYLRKTGHLPAGHMNRRNDELLFRIRWEGYSTDEESLEPESSLEHIDKFQEYKKAFGIVTKRIPSNDPETADSFVFVSEKRSAPPLVPKAEPKKRGRKPGTPNRREGGARGGRARGGSRASSAADSSVAGSARSTPKKSKWVIVSSESESDDEAKKRRPSTAKAKKPAKPKNKLAKRKSSSDDAESVSTTITPSLSPGGSLQLEDGWAKITKQPVPVVTSDHLQPRAPSKNPPVRSSVEEEPAPSTSTNAEPAERKKTSIGNDVQKRVEELFDESPRRSNSADEEPTRSASKNEKPAPRKKTSIGTAAQHMVDEIFDESPASPQDTTATAKKKTHAKPKKKKTAPPVKPAKTKKEEKDQSSRKRPHPESPTDGSDAKKLSTNFKIPKKPKLGVPEGPSTSGATAPPSSTFDFRSPIDNPAPRPPMLAATPVERPPSSMPRRDLVKIPAAEDFSSRPLAEKTAEELQPKWKRFNNVPVLSPPSGQVAPSPPTTGATEAASTEPKQQGDEPPPVTDTSEQSLSSGSSESLPPDTQPNSVESTATAVELEPAPTRTLLHEEPNASHEVPSAIDVSQTDANTAPAQQPASVKVAPTTQNSTFDIGDKQLSASSEAPAVPVPSSKVPSAADASQSDANTVTAQQLASAEVAPTTHSPEATFDRRNKPFSASSSEVPAVPVPSHDIPSAADVSKTDASTAPAQQPASVEVASRTQSSTFDHDDKQCSASSSEAPAAPVPCEPGRAPKESRDAPEPAKSAEKNAVLVAEQATAKEQLKPGTSDAQAENAEPPPFAPQSPPTFDKIAQLWKFPLQLPPAAAIPETPPPIAQEDSALKDTLAAFAKPREMQAKGPANSKSESPVENPFAKWLMKTAAESPRAKTRSTESTKTTAESSKATAESMTRATTSSTAPNKGIKRRADSMPRAGLTPEAVAQLFMLPKPDKKVDGAAPPAQPGDRWATAAQRLKTALPLLKAVKPPANGMHSSLIIDQAALILVQGPQDPRKARVDHTGGASETRKRKQPSTSTERSRHVPPRNLPSERSVIIRNPTDPLQCFVIRSRRQLNWERASAYIRRVAEGSDYLEDDSDEPVIFAKCSSTRCPVMKKDLFCKELPPDTSMPIADRSRRRHNSETLADDYAARPKPLDTVPPTPPSIEKLREFAEDAHDGHLTSNRLKRAFASLDVVAIRRIVDECVPPRMSRQFVADLVVGRWLTHGDGRMAMAGLLRARAVDRSVCGVVEHDVCSFLSAVWQMFRAETQQTLLRRFDTDEEPFVLHCLSSAAPCQLEFAVRMGLSLGARSETDASPLEIVLQRGQTNVAWDLIRLGADCAADVSRKPQMKEHSVLAGHLRSLRRFVCLHLAHPVSGLASLMHFPVRPMSDVHVCRLPPFPGSSNEFTVTITSAEAGQDLKTVLIIFAAQFIPKESAEGFKPLLHPLNANDELKSTPHVASVRALSEDGSSSADLSFMAAKRRQMWLFEWPKGSPIGSDLLRLQLSLDRNARYEPDALFLAQLWHVAHFNPQAAIDF